MRISRLLAIPAVVAAIVGGASAATAQAATVAQVRPAAQSATVNGLPSVTFLRSLATGFALDSNYLGHVYAGPLNYGNYQKWVVNPGSYGGVTLRDYQTWRCLDSNTAGNVYTLPCNGGSFQSWIVQPTSYGTVNPAQRRNGPGSRRQRRAQDLHDGRQRRVLPEVDPHACMSRQRRW